MRRLTLITRYRSPAVHFAALVFICIGIADSGCNVPPETIEAISVHGLVTVRGNVPFNAAILETDSRNYYVLKLTTEQQSVLTTPNRYRVTGLLYLDKWNGKSYAHLEVKALVKLDS